MPLLPHIADLEIIAGRQAIANNYGCSSQGCRLTSSQRNLLVAVSGMPSIVTATPLALNAPHEAPIPVIDHVHRRLYPYIATLDLLFESSNPYPKKKQKHLMDIERLFVVEIDEQPDALHSR